MRFKPLKNLTLGKSKEEPEKEDDEFKAIAANRIADMEKQIQDKTKDLEDKVQQIQDLSPKPKQQGSNGNIPNRPHGPLKELKVEEDDNPDDVISLADTAEDDEAETDGEEIKLVEVHATTVQSQEIKEESAVVQSQEKETEATQVKDIQAEGTPAEATPAEASAAPEKPGETEKEIKPDAGGVDDSLNNLFSDQEEEENPLANLIKSLPDVTAGELIDDLKEIKGIIKEWQKK
jgi:hypothetical protein